MKIIIVGDGKIGFGLTERLAKDGHDIVVIDRNAKVLETCQQAVDVMAVQGNGASMEVLKEAGIENAQLLIAATSSDEINILCCIIILTKANSASIYIDKLVIRKVVKQWL